MIDINLQDWLSEDGAVIAEAPGDPVPTDAPAIDPVQSAPSTDPPQPAADDQQPPSTDPNITNVGPGDQQDVTKDPQTPDMPEDKDEPTDFETWKQSYYKYAIQDDSNKLLELLAQVRNRQGLAPYENKFVEDNWNIQLLRQQSNVEKACKQIRNLVKQQLDRNNPATTLVNHITSVLSTIPLLNNVFIKLNGYKGLKGDLHRKFIGSLVGAVQTGSGGDNEDLVYNEKDYSILISTRFNGGWGDVSIGNWSLKEDDAERYLSEPEVKRLQEGSPQERDALRRRIVIESIAELYETRAFIINVVGEDGTIYTLGWDIANSLRGAFTDGKLIVKTRTSDNSEAMIDDDGNITPLVDISINFSKDGDNPNDDGKTPSQDYPFLQRKNGALFLVADLKLIRDASSSLQGMNFKQTPYSGNPSDLTTLQRCVYTASDLLMRQC